ncbi:hypothetical protein M427DRAFT_37574 [Gonapodya prolifera JEL478]|uniref:Uncharacterized protein n=1 Tax=Gonapodya prolifera (strain JEL478) TaxID=1344416 RepID=A0A139A0D7_GONPJ|nr:hypothetical protein M427DRAFT_37574 [Gonapodya prolifera JEL478]|eukprot:KXS10184.1 hypothetical protein M427DRAFT_37574 [Gonapodya prolifera JEL478]
MVNNRGPVNASSDSSPPDTPSTVVNPANVQSSAMSQLATPATSPQCQSESTTPRSNACSKKKAWHVSDLTKRMDKMEIDLGTPHATQSQASGPMQAPLMLPLLPPQSVILPLQPKESVVYGAAA